MRNTNISNGSRLKFRTFGDVLFSAIITLCLTATGALAAPAVCPDGSIGDHPFTGRAAIAQCIYVSTDGAILRGEHSEYNIYCPGRMTPDDANWAAYWIAAEHAPLAGGRNPILDAEARSGGLRAGSQTITHRFHYGCVNNNQGAVATHIKIRVRWWMPNVAQYITNGCSHFGSQNGDIALNARMDREYRCSNMFRSDDGRPNTYTVAHRLMKRDSDAVATRLGGKICLLASTDIQCAPCTFSNKLIVRVTTVPAWQNCPADSVHLTDSDGSTR